MPEQIKMKNNNQKLILASVLLFFVLSGAMIINAVINNSQAQWAIIPDIKLVGEYKIGDGEWKPIVDGEHISATKGDVMLKGVLNICDPETNDFCGTLTAGALMSFTFNHINLVITENNTVVDTCDTENPVFGEDACGRTVMVVEYMGEDGYFEATVCNSHRFGNDTAIDELLSTMKLYASDYSEKIALRSGQTERLIALIIIVAAFIVLSLALFSFLLHNSSCRKYLFSGLLIFTAGLFFLFTSKAFYFWYDKVIVNTMMTGLSAMAYVFFAAILMKEKLSGKAEKAAEAVIHLYGLFICVLIAVSVFSKLYFYDTLGVWAIGAVAVAAVFIVLSLLCVKNASTKDRFVLIFVSVGFCAFIVDVIAVYFGLWSTGFLSKIFFLVGFIIAVAVFLRIVPENIKTAEKAEMLEKEKIRLDAQLTKSRVSTLMSQIHPHFIYNTLGSIEQLCELDPQKAAKLVNDFAKYLRGNFGELDNPKLIRVSKELEHTKYYISIEKVRFPDIEFITEMDCSDFSIPALTIQPIVENAVKHGILKRDAGGRVTVKAFEADCCYCITVSDNGEGFDVGELESENHIGLRNIKSRLEAMCGGRLYIESIIGVGTKVTVEIPKGVY